MSKPKSVLVVEDHNESCVALKEMLKRRGLHAECAKTIKEAEGSLEYRERMGTPFSCVVSDLVLPDSNAMETVAWLKETNRRLPVRAISGVQDPDVIEACRMAKIQLILKGTSAEGIMESVLYAVTESAQEPDREVFEMIADNRSQQRELKPFRKGFFQNWTTTGKIFAVAGVVVSTVSGTLALGGVLYHSIEDKILKSAKVEEHFAIIDSQLAANLAERTTINGKVRTIEDANIKIIGKLDELARQIDGNKSDYNLQLDRIERKIDRQK